MVDARSAFGSGAARAGEPIWIVGRIGVVEASTSDGWSVVHRADLSRACAWIAACVAVAIGQPARAETCAPPTPACHLENGKALLRSDPRRAAEELLASFKLDERTDTLELYATALQLDHRYALALETWKRVIVFRDSEVETAREAAQTARGGKLAAIRKAMARAQKQSEEAAAAIIKLWPEVGRVRVRIPPGQQFTVSRDGVEVDVSRDVLVNAGGDALVFTRRDGSVERVAVEVAAGGAATIDAPADAVAQRASPAAPRVEKARSPEPEVVAKAETSAKPKASRADPAALVARPDASRSEVIAKPEAGPKPEAVRKPEGGPKPEAGPKSEGGPEPEAVRKPEGALNPEVAPKPEAAPKPGVLPRRAEPEEPEPQETALATERFVEEPRSRTMSRVGLGLTAGAIVAGGLAGSFGYLASRDHDRSRELGCNASDQCPFGPAADVAQRSNDRARVAQISAIAGGALLATGVTLWIVGRSKTRRAAPDVALHIGPSSTSIAWRF